MEDAMKRNAIDDADEEMAVNVARCMAHITIIWPSRPSLLELAGEERKEEGDGPRGARARGGAGGV